MAVDLIQLELILEKIAAGETIDQSLEAHPRLSKERILAVCSTGAGNWANRTSRARAKP